MIEIRELTTENFQDIQLKNDPFEMPGRMIPSLKDGIWDYREERYEVPETMCFPDEIYDYEKYGKDGAVLGGLSGWKMCRFGHMPGQLLEVLVSV